MEHSFSWSTASPPHGQAGWHLVLAGLPATDTRRLQTLMRGYGHRVSIAQGLAEVRAQLTEAPVDVLLLGETGAPTLLDAMTLSASGRAAPACICLIEEDDACARITFGNWRYDSGQRRLCVPGGPEVELSPAESRLLLTFLDHPGAVLSRDALMSVAHGQGFDAYERSIDLLVSRLRQKLRDDARQPRCIRTVRGVGYLFEGM
ncbi:winged helix-turn-helix domain-containing protein [Sphaerotilus sp.]|uniref:winged helix-turn-helix domain-containing protein n=1 Tax=Sphaerotilus sp. TaxID=2093942 RepID=UPI00286E1790|nr:winged helix-turn-helix domain-containing protein [Sphaerotilus sp.]